MGILTSETQGGNIAGFPAKKKNVLLVLWAPDTILDKDLYLWMV